MADGLLGTRDNTLTNTAVRIVLLNDQPQEVKISFSTVICWLVWTSHTSSLDEHNVSAVRPDNDTSLNPCKSLSVSVRLLGNDFLTNSSNLK